MPSQLINNKAVSFVAGKNFTYDGHEYAVGDDVPQDAIVTNVETLVRNRFLIPVVDDMSDKPRHWHREIRQRDIALEKLGVTKRVEDPADHTVAEVKEYVEEHPEEAQELLEAEEQGKDRSTLVEALEEVASVFRPGEHTVDEVLEYLTGDIDDEERERVLQEERTGKARKGIMGEYDDE